MANILITGANGQLGTELRNRSFSLLDDVFYTDVEELDITNFKAIRAFIETHDIDTIINCAAYTAVDQAEEDEEKAMKLNRDAVANLANAAVKLGCLLVHISTDYVFDGTSDHPYTEKDQQTRGAVREDKVGRGTGHQEIGMYVYYYPYGLAVFRVWT